VLGANSAHASDTSQEREREREEKQARLVLRSKNDTEREVQRQKKHASSASSSSVHRGKNNFPRAAKRHTQHEQTRKGHKTRNNTIIKPTSTSLSVCTRTAKNQSSPLALPVVFSARLPPAAPRSTSANPLFFVGLVLLSKSLTADDDDDVADDDDGVFYVSHHSRRRRRMSVTRAKETLRQLPSRVLYFTRCVCVCVSICVREKNAAAGE